MTTLTYTVPQAGTDLNSIADPEIATALNSIKSWANGSIDANNMAPLTALSAAPVVTTPTRVIGTVYQPNIQRPTWVMAWIQVAPTSSDSGMTAQIGSSNPPGIVVGGVYASVAGTYQGMVSFLVPAGWFYRFFNNAAGPTPVIESTVEMAL